MCEISSLDVMYYLPCISFQVYVQVCWQTIKALLDFQKSIKSSFSQKCILLQNPSPQIFLIFHFSLICTGGICTRQEHYWQQLKYMMVHSRPRRDISLTSVLKHPLFPDLHKALWEFRVEENEGSDVRDLLSEEEVNRVCTHSHN